MADSEYFESVAVIGYDAIGEDVAAFTQVFGTKSVLAVLPRLRRDGVLAVPAAHDGRWVYEPQLLPVGAPPEVQAANAVAYALESDPAGPICALHQDDTYGTAGFEGVEVALERLDVDLAASPTFEPIPAGSGDPLDELAAARCATVVFIGLPFHAGSALEEAQRRDLDARWVLLSGAWSPTLLDGEALASYLAEQAWVVGEGPEWGDSAVPGMATLVEAHQRHAPDVEPSSEVVDGYRQAQALHQVLEQAVKAGDLSRQGLATAAGEIGRLQFDGLAGDYTALRSVEARDGMLHLNGRPTRSAWCSTRGTGPTPGSHPRTPMPCGPTWSSRWPRASTGPASTRRSRTPAGWRGPTAWACSRGSSSPAPTGPRSGPWARPVPSRWEVVGVGVGRVPAAVGARGRRPRVGRRQPTRWLAAESAIREISSRRRRVVEGDHVEGGALGVGDDGHSTLLDVEGLHHHGAAQLGDLGH